MADVVSYEINNPCNDKGSVSVGFGLEPLMYLSFPRLRMTIWMEVDYWRKLFPLNLWDVIERDKEFEAVVTEAIVGMVQAVSEVVSEIPKLSPVPMSALLYILLNWICPNLIPWKLNQEKDGGKKILLIIELSITENL